MIQLIVGNEGKGKTKEMLERVNSEIKEASGNIVYLDKNTKHMYELNNKIRLVFPNFLSPAVMNSTALSAVSSRRITILSSSISIISKDLPALITMALKLFLLNSTN